MPPPELRPFSEDFLDAAGELLAARHRAHRAAEPLLPPRFEEPAAARELVAGLAAGENASGAVALRDGRLVGYLLGAPRDNAIWGEGEHVWVELAGHAAEDAETLRDLYGHAAAGWVEQGWVRQYAFAPAHDRELLDAWYRVGFGQQHAHGILETPDADWPDGVRLAEQRDVDELVAMSKLLSDHQVTSPVFGGAQPATPPDELRAEILGDLAKHELATVVAERDGRLVGALDVVPVELSTVHAGLARPEGAALISWAATYPEIRGSGAGLALMQGAAAWARERRHEVIVADWRVTNLLASRFWPGRGFRTTFLRLYRHIP